ncbi:MAG: hypothetical protein WKF88_04275 [Ferruginibacter sp.]
MSELSAHITGLSSKLQQLLKQYDLLRQDNLQQKKTVALLKDKQKLLEEELVMLHQQQLILKASLDKLDTKEKKELEQKINGYTRNIDKCISLLSHKQNV